MKRNETVLVYAVTGLLVLILGIAVIFGNDGAAAPPRENRVGRSEPDHSGVGWAGVGGTGVGPMDQLPPAGSGAVSNPAPVTGSPPAAPKLEVAPKLEARRETGGQQPPTVTSGEPLLVGPPVPVALVAKAGAAEELSRRLGISARDGNYRLVKAQAGDRLVTVLRRWLGTKDVPDAVLDEVIGVNEAFAGGKRIPAGAQVLVPWVEDKDLLQRLSTEALASPDPRITERPPVSPKSERLPGVGPVGPAGERKGRSHTIRKGESLWSIAVRQVGAKKAPAYIAEIARLNPGIEQPDFVRENQEIRLP